MVNLRLSFAANVSNFAVLSDKVEEAVGKLAHSEGFGFDGRDMEFSFATVPQAKAAVRRIEALNLADFSAEIE